jgi:SAM-dependent methyltransferase
MVAEDWDAVARQDDDLPPEWRRRARREHLDLVGRWLGDPAGRWLKTDLAEEGLPDRALLPSLCSATWIGIDIAVEAARRARRAVPRAVVADVRALPFREGSFDGALSTSTLDHFDDPADIDRSLVELAAVVAPGGRLVLTLDNAANPLVRARNALPRPVAARTGLVPFAVGVTLDEAGCRRAVTAAGFDVDDIAHLLHAPHVVATRLARFGWWERAVLPRFARLADTRVASTTGHFVAALATRPWPGRRRAAETT